MGQAKVIPLRSTTGRPMAKERPFCAKLMRSSYDKTRRYSSLDNALTTADRWIRRDGRVNSIVVIYHAVTGRELGTIRMTAKGHLVKKWIREA